MYMFIQSYVFTPMLTVCKILFQVPNIDIHNELDMHNDSYITD